MNARHYKLLVPLLSLFIVRSMLPIGFMLSFDTGVARLALCSSQAAIPDARSAHSAAHQAQAHEAHAGAHANHVHHEGVHEVGNEADHGQQTCPFAFAGAAPLLLASLFTPEAPVTAAFTAPATPKILAAPLYAHPIRGPPAIS